MAKCPICKHNIATPSQLYLPGWSSLVCPHCNTKLAKDNRAVVILGILLMTISFFLTLGLLQRFDLSYLYPFQGLSVIIISLIAAAVLKETLTWRLMIGAILITAGVVLVSMS